VPVYFNEPLSFLQKFSEDLEYYDLLDKAVAGISCFFCKETDTLSSATTSLERMQWIAVFAVSPYAATTRTAKPFNPILGETFEMMRDDLGYRYFAEQVSHHPPISACHCDGNGYTYWAEAHINNKFKGNVLEVNPSGSFHVLIHATKEHFVWHRRRSSTTSSLAHSGSTTWARCSSRISPRARPPCSTLSKRAGSAAPATEKWRVSSRCDLFITRKKNVVVFYI